MRAVVAGRAHERARARRLVALAAIALAVALEACGSDDQPAVDMTPDAAGTDAAANDSMPLDVPDGSALETSATDAGGDAADDADLDADRPDGAGDAPPGECIVHATVPAAPRRAASSGFSGTESAYYALYEVACQSVADCSAPCVAAGGTADSCTAGSACSQPSAGKCLPPTYFRNVTGALSASASTSEAAVLTLVEIDYHDALRLSDFGVALPEGASVRGVRFEVRRSTEDGLAVDHEVRLLKDGSLAGANRSLAEAWPKTLDLAVYGAEDDTWETGLSAADVASSGFGISIAPVYTGSGGNDRAYVDAVRLVVFYTLGCT